MSEPGAAPDLTPPTILDETFLRPVRPGNAFEETVQRLLQTIRLGVVPPGDRLPAERELALSMSVSRDTVREAIKALADAGYLVSRRGRYGGTFVIDPLPPYGTPIETSAGAASPHEPPSAAELDDVLTAREVLEVGLARAAATRTLTSAAREQLWSRARAVADATPADYRRLDARLHLAIAELAGAPSLLPLMADNRMLVDAYLDHIPVIEANIKHSNEQHQSIVVAILAVDADGAAAAMTEHCEASAALLRGFLA